MATRTKKNGETEEDIEVASGTSTTSIVTSSSGNKARCSVIVLEVTGTGEIQLLEETSGTALSSKRTIVNSGTTVIFEDVVTLTVDKDIQVSRSASMSFTGFSHKTLGPNP